MLHEPLSLVSRRRSRVGQFLALFLLLPVALSAATRWAASAAVGDGDGSSPAHAGTLAAMITASAGGDTIYVLEGSYASDTYVIPAGKTGLALIAAGPVTLNETCIEVRSEDVTISGFDFVGIAPTTVVGAGGPTNIGITNGIAAGGLRVMNCTFVHNRYSIFTGVYPTGGSRPMLIAGNRILTTPEVAGVRNRIFINPTLIEVEMRRNFFVFGPSNENNTYAADNVLAPTVNFGFAPDDHGTVVVRNDFVPTGDGRRVVTRYPSPAVSPVPGQWYDFDARNNWWGNDAGPGNLLDPSGEGPHLYADDYAADNWGDPPYAIILFPPTHGEFDISDHSTTRNLPLVGAFRLGLSAPASAAPDVPVTLTATLDNGPLDLLDAFGYTMAGLPAGLTVRFLDADTLASVGTGTTNGSGVATLVVLPQAGANRYVAIWSETDNPAYTAADGFGAAVSTVATVNVVVPPQRWAAPVAVGAGDGSSPENAGTLQAMINAADPGDAIEILPGDYGVAYTKTSFTVPVAKTGLILRGRGAARILNGIQVSAQGVTVTQLEFTGSADLLGTWYQLYVSAGGLKVYNNRFSSGQALNKAIESTTGLADSPLGDFEIHGNTFGENGRIYVNRSDGTVVSRRSVFATSASFDDNTTIDSAILVNGAVVTLTPDAPGGAVNNTDIYPAGLAAGLRRFYLELYNPDVPIDVTGVYWGDPDGPGNLGGAGRWADEYDPDGAWVDQTLGIAGAEDKWLGLDNFAAAPNAPVVGPFAVQVVGGLVSTQIPTVLTAVLSSGSVEVDAIERATPLPAGQTVSFQLNGVSVGTALTDASGVASLPITFEDAEAGTYTVTASWAGDLLDGYPPAASNLATLVVEELSLVNIVAYTGQEVPAYPGVTLGSFSGVSANHFSTVSFVATLQGAGVTSTNNLGVFTTLGGVPVPIARKGDTFDEEYQFGTFTGTVMSNTGRVGVTGVTTGSRPFTGFESDSGLDIVVVQNRSVSPVSPTQVGTVYPLALDDAGRAMIRAGLIPDGVTVTADNDSFVASFAADGTVTSALLEGALAPANWSLDVGARVGQITGGPSVAQRDTMTGAPVYGLSLRLGDNTAPAAVVVGGTLTQHLNMTAPRALAGNASPASGDDAAGPFTGPAYVSFGEVLVNPQNHAVFAAKVTGSSLNDDVIVYTPNATNAILVAREGQAAPGLAGVTFRAITAPVLSSNERVYFQALLAGTGVTSANQLSLWRFRIAGGVPTLQLVARTGSAVPHLGGVTYTALGAVATTSLNRGAFVASLSGPTAQNRALIGFGGTNLNDPSDYVILARKGDVVQVNGVPRTIAAIELISSSDGSGKVRSLVSTTTDDLGDVLRALTVLRFTDGTEAVAFFSQL